MPNVPNSFASTRRRILLASAQILALLALGAAPPLAMARPQNEEKQIWVSVKLVDRLVENQKIDVQLPIELIREWGTIRFWNSKHDKVLGQLDGGALYTKYKEFPIRKEEKVLVLKDADVDVAVVVSSKEPPSGASANVLNIEMIDRAQNHQATEAAYDIGSLQPVVQRYLDNMPDGHRLKNRIEGIERLQYVLGRLGELPPYVVLKIDGADIKLTIKTE